MHIAFIGGCCDDCCNHAFPVICAQMFFVTIMQLASLLQPGSFCIYTRLCDLYKLLLLLFFLYIGFITLIFFSVISYSISGLAFGLAGTFCYTGIYQSSRFYY